MLHLFCLNLELEFAIKLLKKHVLNAFSYWPRPDMAREVGRKGFAIVTDG